MPPLIPAALSMLLPPPPLKPYFQFQRDMKSVHGDDWKLRRLDGMRQSQLCGAMWRQLPEGERTRRNAVYGRDMDAWRRLKAQLLLERERSTQLQHDAATTTIICGGASGSGVDNAGGGSSEGVGKKTERIMRLMREERREREQAAMVKQEAQPPADSAAPVTASR